MVRAKVRAYDPEGAREASKLLDVELCGDAYEAISGADGVVILTEWNEFRALNLNRIKKEMRQPVLVDLRNVYDPKRVRALGFTYASIGRADEIRARKDEVRKRGRA